MVSEVGSTEDKGEKQRKREKHEYFTRSDQRQLRTNEDMMQLNIWQPHDPFNFSKTNEWPR